MPPEEEFPEQFSSYMFLVMEIIALAKKLDRVFVLPYLHSHPRNSLLCEAGETEHIKMIYGKTSFPMESFFNIKKLNEYVETISFDDFKEISGKKLSALSCFGKTHDKTIEVYGTTFQCEKVVVLSEVDSLKDMGDTSIAITGYQRGKFLVKTTPNWYDDPNVDYWGIRSHLVYRDSLVKKADDFISTNMKGRKYLALHWRRGDRNHPEVGKIREEIVDDEIKMKKLLQHYIIRPVLKALGKNKLEQVFISTNSGTRWHIDYLKEYLPLVEHPQSNSWQEFEFDSVVEQIICTKSDYYISSPSSYDKCSSFSRWILDTRKLAGNINKVEYLKKMIPIKEGILQRIIVKFKKYLPTKDSEPKIGKVENENSPLKGVLFDDKIVNIDPRSVNVGGSWYLDKNTRPISWDSKIIKLFSEESKKFTKPIVFDIGANTGSFSLLPVVNPDMIVYSFEPQPDIFDLLKRNVSFNDLEEKVFPHKLVLSDKKGLETLHIPVDSSQSGLATLGNPERFEETKDVTVTSTTIDQFAEEHKIEYASLVKIDTEGSELFVLKGGEKFIRLHMPTMLIEHNVKNISQFGYDRKEVLHMLISWGYTVSMISPEDILCVSNKQNKVE